MYVIINNELICPQCGGKVKYYDHVKRIVIYPGHKVHRIIVPRYRCCVCNKIHRQLPECIFPHKHYHSAVILAILNGFVDDSNLLFEDYPSEETVKRWKSMEFAQFTTSIMGTHIK